MYKNNITKEGSFSGILCFNPCFNGSMYKNLHWSPLVCQTPLVSILVLMDLCIKTIHILRVIIREFSFNPCFNGSMYKNERVIVLMIKFGTSFNPCFNGSMYKNLKNIEFSLSGW